MAVEFGTLGEVLAQVDGAGLDLGHARQRCVLAVLLVKANRMVTTDQLVDRVWGERAPRRARHALYSYLSRLRRVLDAVPEVDVARVSGGYVLRVDAEAVDLHLFRVLVARARDAGDGPQALDLYERALRLWRGEPFKGSTSRWLASVADRLLEERFSAEVQRNEVALHLGMHARLPAELATASAARPFDERLAAQYVLALYRCGRQADALAHFRAFRDRLVDEVGVEPGEELQHLHRRILAAQVTSTTPLAAGEPVPRQLPAASPWFVARTRELDRLDTALDEAVGLVVVTGTGGTGKTSLALHWAHKRAERFPGGQLYVNLRGFDGAGGPLPPEDALQGFVEALGGARERIPATLDARAALYRSLLAGRQALVVLDNAYDTDQVRPLLPGDAKSVAVVTSRGRMAGLVAREGAVPITLGALAGPEAVALLTRRLGRDRVAAEPEAVAELVEHAARIPLALAVVAERAVSNPSSSLRALAVSCATSG